MKLYTVNGWLAQYVNYSSIKLVKKKKGNVITDRRKKVKEGGQAEGNEDSLSFSCNIEGI